MSTMYDRMEQALAFIETHLDASPSLDTIAHEVGMSPHHFQRRFRRWVGVSPKQFIRNRIIERAKPLLSRGASSLETAVQVGLSGPGRLHDLFVSIEAVTPGEYKSRGQSLTIRFGVQETPFGPCWIALSDRGICNLAFSEELNQEEAEAAVRREQPLADILFAPKETADVINRIFGDHGEKRDRPFHLFLRGTNFQVQVWRALLRIPTGDTVTYSELCSSLGCPSTHARAVAGAVARNPVAFLIPCHRVIRKTGALGGYRYGLDKKQRLLDAERAAIQGIGRYAD